MKNIQANGNQVVVEKRLYQQLPLGISLKEDFVFGDFLEVGNEQLLLHLQTQLASCVPFFLFLWGERSSGCSHLLQAACQSISGQRSAIYLPLRQLIDQSPQLLEGLENISLICIDDLQLVVGNDEWEEALFHFFNRIFEQGSALLIAAKSAPQGLDIKLPDLLSRIASAVVYQVKELDDSGKVSLLQARALSQGLILTEESAHYIFNRAGRSLQELMHIMKHLDDQSLSANRKLTIPFIKQVMNW